MSNDEEKKGPDPRLTFVTNRIIQMCPHLKKDKLVKSLQNKDSVEIVNDFFDSASDLLLISGDSGMPTIEMPERLPKNKWVYFLKNDPSSELPIENIELSLTCGEMARK